MTSFPFPLPAAPDWRLDWKELAAACEWLEPMKACPQDPIHHAEGDVWTHVRMVCEALVDLPEWRVLDETGRDVLLAAALLHDVAKPACTRQEDGRVTSRGHSPRGAIQARRILWQWGWTPTKREQVCSLVRHHQSPFHLIERSDSEQNLFRMSQTVRCEWLALLARADILGRVCADQNELLSRLDLFALYCQEMNCWQSARTFPSGLSRFEYFRSENRDPDYHAHDTGGCEVIVMSGLPGSGKDTWVRQHALHLPVVSLDVIRDEMSVDATDNQGTVVQAARSRAREHLRSGRSFVWNATNLTREMRGSLINLFTNYGARVRIVYVEAAATKLHAQNSGRTAAVPGSVMERMLERWEVPEPYEAPLVEWWCDGQKTPLYMDA